MKRRIIYLLVLMILSNNVFGGVITFSQNSFVYDGVPSSDLSNFVNVPSFSVTGCSLYNVSYSFTGVSPTVYPTSNIAPKDVGFYTITATLSGGNCNGQVSDPYQYSITQATLNINANNIDKAYGSTVTNIINNSPSFTASGLKYNETVGSVTLSFSNGGILSTDIVGSTSVITPSNLTGGTFNINNYSINYNPGLLTVIKKTLSVTSALAQSKVYDGNTNATITGTLVGVVGAENVTLIGTGTFADKNVNNNIGVTSTSTLGGTDNSNYSLTQPTGLTANITSKALSVTSALAQSKVYDGNTNATITGTLVGVVGAENVTLIGTGTFADKNVNNNIGVTSTSTLGGTDNSNYSLTQPTGLRAAITPKPITITGITGGTKVYDGNTTATVTGTPVYGGLVSGEILNVVGTATYSFADKNAGTAKTITVAGFTAPNGNYILSSQPTGLTGNITQRLLNVTSTGYEKVYDATKNASGIILSIDRILGDDVSISRIPLFDNANVGVNKDIILTGITINPGLDAANYYLASNTATVKGTITPLPININANDTVKTELDPDPVFTFTHSPALYTPEVFTGALSRISGETPADYPLTIGSLSAGNNYTLNLNSAKLTIKPLVTNYIFEVPNAFTPNLDGTNDLLKIIKNYRVTGLNYFRIYNRTGQLVFETNNLAQGWNGRRMGDMSGNVLEADLYVWIAEFTTMNDPGPVKKTGSVLLLK